MYIYISSAASNISVEHFEVLQWKQTSNFISDGPLPLTAVPNKQILYLFSIT